MPVFPLINKKYGYCLMDQLNFQPSDSAVIAVKWLDRWQVYHRLQALEIPCTCCYSQPLQISLTPLNATMAIQVWSVVRQIKEQREELIRFLEQCWQL